MESYDTVPVTLPFPDLRADSIRVEPGAKGTTVRSILCNLTDRYERDQLGADPDAAIARIVAGAAALHAKTNREIGECLETALIWEVG